MLFRSVPKSKGSPFDKDDEDMDDLDALLAEQEEHLKSTTTQQGTVPLAQGKMSTRPEEDEFPIDEDDDLDALLADQEARETLNKQGSLPPSTSAISSAPVMPAMDEDLAEADADGADMFSSSPVRGTASSSLLRKGEHGSENTRVKTPDPQQRDEDNNQADKEEESQGLDADDMFPSSPV